ncbi:MAG: hypothetical protein ACM3WQ_00440 [Chloroflexota bacterium]
MFEGFKEKIKDYEDIEKVESAATVAEIDAKLRMQGLDPATVTIKDLLPEFLDDCGNDISLMSAKEWEIEVTYHRTRKLLLQKYPQPKEETKILENAWNKGVDESYDINISKAAEDPQSKVFLKALCQIKAIYDKLEVLQSQASEYEKYCLRLYWYLTYNWNHAEDVKSFRRTWSYSDIFELVDVYFKICKKYRVPTFEEPYYFLDCQQRQEIKLEGDMLKRTTNYSEIEIQISILEAFL